MGVSVSSPRGSVSDGLFQGRSGKLRSDMSMPNPSYRSQFRRYWGCAELSSGAPGLGGWK